MATATMLVPAGQLDLDARRLATVRGPVARAGHVQPCPREDSTVDPYAAVLLQICILSRIFDQKRLLI